MLNLLIGKKGNTFESTCSDLTGLDNFFFKLHSLHIAFTVHCAIGAFMVNACYGIHA